MYPPQGAQWTGTNRPRTCPTHPQPHQNHHERGPGNQRLCSRPLCISQRPHPHPPGHRTREPGGHRQVVRPHRGWFGVPVATAEGKRPDPSRTRKLSPPAPMVLRTARSWESRTPPEHPTTPGNSTRPDKRRRSPADRRRFVVPGPPDRCPQVDPGGRSVPRRATRPSRRRRQPPILERSARTARGPRDGGRGMNEIVVTVVGNVATDPRRATRPRGRAGGGVPRREQ